VNSIHVDGTKLRAFCTKICTVYEKQIYDIIELIIINVPFRDCPFPCAIPPYAHRSHSGFMKQAEMSRKVNNIDAAIATASAFAGEVVALLEASEISRKEAAHVKTSALTFPT
jgi:hypothetical protein